MNWNLPLFYSSLVGYSLVSLLFGLGFARRNERYLRMGTALAATGLFGHAIVIIHEWTSRGRLPAQGWSDVTTLLSTAVLLALLAVGLSRRFRVLGAFVAPVGLAVCLAALLGPGARATADFVEAELHPWWQTVHVGSIVIAFLALTVAFAAAILYLVTVRRLKGHDKLSMLAGPDNLLPSLEGLDLAVHHALQGGVALLTIGIVTGAVWAGVQQDASLGIGPKVTATVLAWLFFALAMQLRWVAGWSGRRGAGMVVGGYGWLLLAMFAVRHVTS